MTHGEDPTSVSTDTGRDEPGRLRTRTAGDSPILLVPGRGRTPTCRKNSGPVGVVSSGPDTCFAGGTIGQEVRLRTEGPLVSCERVKITLTLGSSVVFPLSFHSDVFPVRPSVRPTDSRPPVRRGPSGASGRRVGEEVSRSGDGGSRGAGHSCDDVLQSRPDRRTGRAQGTTIHPYVGPLSISRTELTNGTN